MRRSAKFFILDLEGIIGQISHESVDEKSLRLCPGKRGKNELTHLTLYCLNSFFVVFRDVPNLR